MTTDHRGRLKAIRTFPQLVAYLRNEMGWPIGTEDFEDLTFEYTPEELGIDAKNAAKIQEIKRLRPLSVHQPWGIFFVKFEPKRLPVVALRRILNQVALKKRASTNSVERAAWSTDNLLFVSNYGEGEARQISFAHFSQNEAKKNLPTLKVLGWDNLDTPLHLDHVAELLTKHLSWPADEENAEAWGEQWRSAFTLVHREVINTSKKLSVELARLARDIRNRINTVLTIETEGGPVTKLMAAFKEALVHDLDEDGFADMYAQTIAYGLLSARIANPTGDGAGDFAAAMPVTNPFLKELMETFLMVGSRKGMTDQGPGLDFDELGVSEVVELLDAANMEAVVRDFGDKNPQEDPVIHFYEHFLKEYDAKMRMQRGVFYTPRPVVSFIVRSVDEVLRTEFGLEDGLADTTTWSEMAGRFDDLEIPEGASPNQAFVQILDPATGTGTFLVEVIDIIHKTMTEKWQAEGHVGTKVGQLWNDYVPNHLLPRLHGYELMMAPYAIAHMKIGLKLFETGYHFESDERVRVYLTNSLEPAQDFSGTLAFAIPALAHEAEAVNAIKRDQRFTVVIGNPPYSYMSGNLSEDARALVDRFRSVDGEPIVEKNAIGFERTLQDDYVKFYAFALNVVDATGACVLSFISNNTFLENINLRGMRRSLISSSSALSVLDLHGDANQRERDPAGGKDENVFAIKKGVAISLAVRVPGRSIASQVERADIFGSGKKKSNFLSVVSAGQIEWESFQPRAPMYRLRPTDDRLYAEWQGGINLKDVFLSGATGVETGKDAIMVAFTNDELLRRMERISDPTLPDKLLVDEFQASSGHGARVLARRRSIDIRGDDQDAIVPFCFSPFDVRALFYRPDLIQVHSKSTARNLITDSDNYAFVFMRQVVLDAGFSHIFVSRHVVNNRSFYSTRGKAYMFPIWRITELMGRQYNLDDKVLMALGGYPSQDFHGALAMVYAQAHSPTYRDRYGQFLKEDYPRAFRPRESELAKRLSELGSQLIALHLMESPRLEDGGSTRLVGSGGFLVERVIYSDGTVWIDKAKTRGFRGVPEKVWNFHIGGYQVCHKWLKDRQAKGGKNPRPGRVLTDEDKEHYQKIVVALSETIRIMAEIDDVIDAHGGWPGAFRTESVQAEETADYIRIAAEPRVEYGAESDADENTR